MGTLSYTLYTSVKCEYKYISYKKIYLKMLSTVLPLKQYVRILRLMVPNDS